MNTPHDRKPRALRPASLPPPEIGSPVAFAPQPLAASGWPRSGQDRAGTHAGDRPRSRSYPGSQRGPIKLAQAVLHTPGRLLNAGHNVLRSAEQLPQVMARIGTVLDAAESLVSQVRAVTARADTAVSDIDATRREAHDVVLAADHTEQRLRSVFARLQPLLAAAADIDPTVVRDLDELLGQLRPVLHACADLDAEVASQAAQLLARTGPLLDQIDTVVLPVLNEMRGAVPDVRDILPVVQRLEPVMVDVETRIAGLPGAARLRKRGEREIADAEGSAESNP